MRAGFDEISRIDRRPDRTAALTAWFQGLFQGDPPVLVGGGAVELYTAGAYVTGDLDFVGRLTDSVKAELRKAGFQQRGRHWVHEKAKVFLELPGSDLGAGERAVDLQMQQWVVRVVSPEDALIDRLAAWKHWRSSVDGVSAFLIWKQQGAVIDAARLRMAARREHVADALDEVLEFSRRLGDRIPTEEEVRAWAERER